MALFIGGIALIFVAIGIAMVIDGNALSVLLSMSSFVLVFFATLGAGVMAYRPTELRKIPTIMKSGLKQQPSDLDATVTQLAAMADVARREGMLALEARLDEVEDPSIRQALQLVVDGLDAEAVREMVEIDISAVEQRHTANIGFFQALGGYAPTFGMVGTVIGLINMLQNLTNPEQLGVGMALALLTTLYGVMLANVVFIPFATRLQRLSEAEIRTREAALDGIIALQGGISPRLLVERLETYLPPERRIGYQERANRPARTAAAEEAA
ncbi:motility protein A [Egibacter rhizosphaerae]|uniref:Motility protein A n=1 Tax=Egibacter rhizosphaerae TaxID=1670831 RepID=A0A411YJ51_9ACTN|nr:MotA/TolQ/ExbB proton channel family protein [Egibacter rhizosphaerae]QBI21243.1 motility protein A [Egibacter rhizosphaerae]